MTNPAQNWPPPAAGPQPPPASEAPPVPPYGYYPAPAPQRMPLPRSVSIASILLFISGGFTVLAGLAVLGVANGNGEIDAIGLVVTGIGVLEIIIGVQLRRYRPWARWATVVVCGLGALLQLIGLAQGAGADGVGCALNVLVVFLMFRPDTVAAFPSRRQ